MLSMAVTTSLCFLISAGSVVLRFISTRKTKGGPPSTIVSSPTRERSSIWKGSEVSVMLAPRRV